MRVTSAPASPFTDLARFLLPRCSDALIWLCRDAPQRAGNRRPCCSRNRTTFARPCATGPPTVPALGWTAPGRHGNVAGAPHRSRQRAMYLGPARHRARQWRSAGSTTPSPQRGHNMAADSPPGAAVSAPSSSGPPSSGSMHAACTGPSWVWRTATREHARSTSGSATVPTAASPTPGTRRPPTGPSPATTR